MYDSLKGVVQETLQRNKPIPTTPGPVTVNHASTVNDAVEELEKLIASKIGTLKVAVNESTAMVANKARHAEQAIDDLKSKTAALEIKLRETEEIVRGKDAITQGLEQNLNTRIQDLETQLRTKEQLLVARSREVIDLKAQLDHLRNGIKEVSSFFKQSQVLGVIEEQDNNAVSRKAEEKSATTQAKGQPATDSPPDAGQETVAPEFFKRMTHELTQTIGPMASMIVHDHVKALGETVENFPKARVNELLDTVSAEISDEKVKNGFRERLAEINGHL